MKICKHEWEFDYTIDKALPFGEIESVAIFKCKICDKEMPYSSWEVSRKTEFFN